MSEIRQALRFFFHRPLVTAIAAIALGTGLGASIAAFGVVDRIVLRKPELKDSDRLVTVWETNRKEPAEQKLVSPADFHDLRASGAFSSAGAWMKWDFDLTGAGAPERLRGALVSGDFFPTLEADAQAGRTLSPADARSGRNDVVVLSDAVWRRTFGADPSIVGKQITVAGDRVTVLGVMPASFAFPDHETDVWTPLVWGVHFQPDDRAGRNLRVIARLRPGVALKEANAVAAAVVQRAAAATPAANEGWSASVVGLHDQETRAIRPTLLMILAAAGAMLAIACANVANLMLMIGSTRKRELATRLALGATRIQLLRQSIAEGAMLGVPAAALGIAFALGALRVAGTFRLPIPDGALTLSLPVIAIGAVTALLAGIVTTIVPMVFFTRFEAFLSIRESHQMSSSGGLLRSVLVVAQIAFTSALLISGGVLVKSFTRLMSVPLGFESGGVLTARVWLPKSYDTRARQVRFFDALTERLSRLPGVRTAATVQDLPLRGNAMTFPATVDDRATEAAYRVVSDRYFEAMRIPLLRGRGFTPHDDAASPPVFVINRALANKVFGARDPIGRPLRIDGDAPAGTIVGVVADVKQMGLAESDVPAAYQPVRQKQFDFLRWTTLVLRTDGSDPVLLEPAVRRTVAELDPNLPAYDIITLDALLFEHTAKPRVTVWTVAVLAAIGFVLALIGIGSVLSYAIAQRTRELAIRMAIGARNGEVVLLILVQAWKMVTAGLVAGVTIAFIAAPLLDRLLFGVRTVDASVMAPVAVAIFTAVTMAALVPAFRATRVDPALALRAE